MNGNDGPAERMLVGAVPGAIRPKQCTQKR